MATAGRPQFFFLGLIRRDSLSFAVMLIHSSSVCGPLPAFVKRALRNKSDFSNFTSILARYVNVDPEEIKFFRNIHFVENKIVIQRIGQKLVSSTILEEAVKKEK